MKSIDLAILAAVPEEIDSICEVIPRSGSIDIAGKELMVFDFGELSLMIGTSGIGKVNAASEAASILTLLGPIEVWNVGCAGTYVESGLCVGDVLITREWVCGDEGVLWKNGPTSMQGIGIPLLAKDGTRYFDKFPVSSFKTCMIASKPPDAGRYAFNSFSGEIEPANTTEHPDSECFSLKYGPSLTVGMVSGDPEVAAERYIRHNVLAENMEGSAMAQVCLRFGAPFLECRGISNVAGVRDKKEWDIRRGVSNCHSVVLHILNSAIKMNAAEAPISHE